MESDAVANTQQRIDDASAAANKFILDANGNVIGRKNDDGTQTMYGKKNFWG
jgi:hypothetical protein